MAEIMDIQFGNTSVGNKQLLVSNTIVVLIELIDDGIPYR